MIEKKVTDLFFKSDGLLSAYKALFGDEITDLRMKESEIFS